MIIPSINIRSGRAVQLRQGREFVLDGGDPFERLEEFALVGEIAIVDLDAALGTGDNTLMIQEMVRRAPCRVGGGIRTADAAIAWLDAGARTVVLGTAARPEIVRELPRDRIIAAVDAREGEIVVDGWRERTGVPVLDRIIELRDLVGGFLLTQVEHEGGMQGFDGTLLDAAREAAGTARITAAGGITTAAEIVTLDRRGIDAQVGMALYTGRLALPETLAALPEARDGRELWPTIIADASGVALGLAWSTRETLATAVRTRRGTYWSRSRNAEWVKGASSGDTQRLLRVELDCDRDALLFTVVQEGTGFCHRGTRSCFDAAFRLGDLSRIVDARGRNGGSGRTARLFTEPGLLQSKLLEEARELADATTSTEVTHEAADLMYFTLAAMARRGVSLRDVERELARRHGAVTARPMRAKEAGVA